jgi:very-short-patch-repair endonuclease
MLWRMDWHLVARRQHGVISRRQLILAGLSDRHIRTLIGQGHLVTDAVQGVYRSTTVQPTTWTLSWAAVLGARAVLSHQSAALVWGIDLPHGRDVHVTVPSRRRTRMPAGVLVHRVALDAADVVDHQGIAMTSRVRTVLDCLGVLPGDIARTLFDRALQKRWVGVHDVRSRLIGERGRWGNQQIRRLLAEATMGDSEAERVLHAILREAGITGWQANAVVEVAFGAIEVDVLFSHASLVIEVDGWAHHTATDRFQEDRRRQNALIGAGWNVLRFTWRDLIERPDAVVATVQAGLARAAA